MTITEPPPMLSPLLACVAESADRWFVVHVETNREKTVARELLAADFKYYLPLRRIRRNRAGHRETLDIAMFDGYLFASGTDVEKCSLLDRHKFKYIYDTISTSLQRQLVRELSSLEIALHANPCLGDKCAVPIGARRRVVSGPYEGVEVVICQKTKRTVLAINVLNAGQVIDVDPAFLEEI